MNNKIFLVLFGLIVVLAVLTTAKEEEENSLSQEISLSRDVRDAGRERQGTNQKKKNNKRQGGMKKNGKRQGGKKKNNKRQGGKKKNNKRQGGKKKNNKRQGGKKKNNKRQGGKKKNNKRRGGKREPGKRQNTLCPACPTCPSPVPAPGPVPVPPPPKCLETALKAMKMLKDNVANFDKQASRIEKQTKIAMKKADKQDAFTTLASTLVTIGGGNKAALSCSGSTSNDGAKQLKNLTDTLDMCMMKINSTCNTTSGAFADVNMTMVDECKNITGDFKTEAMKCFAMGDDGCDCWNAEGIMMMMEKVKTCTLKDEAAAVADALSDCKTEFSTCRKFEDDSCGAIAACSQDTSTLKAKAAALDKNKDALAKAQAKIKSLTSRRRHHRQSRAVPTTCAELITAVTSLVNITDNTDSTIETLANEIANATVTCTDDEKKSLETLSEQVDTLAESVSDALDAVQDLLEEITGTTVDVSSVSTSTAAASRRRRNLVRFV